MKELTILAFILFFVLLVCLIYAGIRFWRYNKRTKYWFYGNKEDKK